MATKVASLYAEVTAKIDGFTAGLSTAKSQLGGFAGSFQSFTSVAAMALGGAALAAVAFGKALEFGEEGAQIDQVRSSFENLTSTLGAAPNVLDELKTATRGTVSELDLMASTNTLLMGTSQELGQQLAQNAPQLAAIAQAAHDLNPTMGTTSEMYDRLARGIKKAEPELLDEVGILMNLTQVYRDYAASHGITVSAMDKTMKTEAMLNAVLQQGTTLIEQAKGVNTSYTTSIERMQTSMEDAGNAMKEVVAPAIANIADSIYYTIKGTDALDAQAKQLEVTAGSYSEYVNGAKQAAEANGYMINSVGALVQVVDGVGKVVQWNYLLSESAWNVARGYGAIGNNMSSYQSKLNDVTTTTAMSEKALATYSARLQGQADDYGMSEQAISSYSERMTGLAASYGVASMSLDELRAAEQNRIETAGLMAGLTGTLGDATAQYSLTLSQLTAQEVEITSALEKATEQYGANSTQVLQLNSALEQNQAAQGSALTALQGTTAEMIYSQAAMGLNTQAALDMARGMGLLSEQDYVVGSSIQALREQFTGFSDGILTADEGAASFTAQVMSITKAAQSLQAKNLPVTFDNLSKELQEMSTTDAGSKIDEVGKGADEAAPAVDDVAKAAEDAAPALDQAGDAANDTAESMREIAAAAGAASTVSALGDAARKAQGAIASAAYAAQELASALDDMKSKNIKISVSTSGFEAAIEWVNALSGALEGIPTSITATVNLGIGTGSPGGYGGPPKPPRPSPRVEPVVYETYNIYDPLAAVMLAEQKRQSTARKLEEVMYG